MTIVALKGFRDLRAIEEGAAALEEERPDSCPGGCQYRMWKHTGYRRTAIDESGKRWKVFVPRFRCGQCGQTISCLFDVLIPYVRFTIQAVVAHVETYLMRETTYEEMAWSEDNEKGPSKSTMFRWVNRLAERAEKLASTVQREAVLIDPGNADMEPVESNCPNSSKARIDGKAGMLDRGAECIGLAERFLVYRPFEEDSILTVLHRYCMTAAETVWSILSGRVGLSVSSQQRVKYVIF